MLGTMRQITERDRKNLTAALERSGLRATRQREQVFGVLVSQRDHPTAEEVFARARKQLSTISLATVYNCLETLVECDLIKKLNYEREPSRYCPNHGEHAHFLDEATGRVFDIDIPKDFHETLTTILPKGFAANKIKLSFSGRVEPEAAERQSNSSASTVWEHIDQPNNQTKQNRSR